MSLVHKTDGMNGMVAGLHTTVAASDAVTTGLRYVRYAFATLEGDPALAVSMVSVDVPDQVAYPGIINIKTWKATSSGDTTPVAATTFSKTVNWIAFGD